MTEQAAAVVDETTVAADLVTQLEYDRYTHENPVPDWRPAKSFAAMVGALLLQELEDASDGYPEQEANGAITDISSCTEDALATSADVLGI